MYGTTGRFLSPKQNCMILLSLCVLFSVGVGLFLFFAFSFLRRCWSCFLTVVFLCIVGVVLYKLHQRKVVVEEEEMCLSSGDSTLPATLQRFVNATEQSNVFSEKKMGLVLFENDGYVFGYIHFPYAQERRLIVKSDESRVCICEPKSYENDSEVTILRRITLPKCAKLDSLSSFVFMNGVGFCVSLE